MAGGKLNPPWKKGQSGNPKGKAKGTRNRSTVVKEMLDVVTESKNPFDRDDPLMYEMTNEEKMTAKMIIQAASSGDVAAYKALMDSAYGTPKQTIDQNISGAKPPKVRFFDKEDRKEGSDKKSNGGRKGAKKKS